MSFEYSDYGKKAPKQIGEYKSLLEFVTANWLTSLKVPFIYEPFTYLTKKGNYTPDFYLTEINTFIEVKPTLEAITPPYQDLLEQFCKEKKGDLFILTPNEVIYIEYYKKSLFDFGLDELVCDRSIFVAACIKCKTIFFTSVVGIYGCRKCNNHNGDHDIFADALALFRNYYYNWQKERYGRVFK